MSPEPPLRPSPPAECDRSRRKPEHGVLHTVLREHVETFLAHAQERDRPVPRFLERELRAYLECGLLCYGFVRLRCVACGHDRLDYQLTEKLTLTLGTRWTWEEKVAVVFPFSLGNSLCNATFTECVGDERRRDDQDTWNYWSRHAGLRYQINDDLMVYGSYTRSFRAGGYNLRADIRIPFSPYDEERIDAYELGFKADWLDNTLRTNLSAFYNRGDDIQRTIFVEFIQDQLNAAKAHVAGVEAEVTWLPIEGLTLNSTGGWVDAEYDSYTGVCNGLQTTGPCSKVFGVPPSEISSGVGRELDFAFIPEWTWSAMGRYEFPFPVLLDGTLALQASVYWRDDTFGDERNEVPVDSYTLWDASISYRAPDDRYTISFFGKNLTERPYTNFAVASLGTIIDISPGEQRTWGVEVSFDY